jgi:sugar phosphate isomerase/epimerase
MNFQFYGFDSVPEMKKLKGYINQIHIKDIDHKLNAKARMPRDVIGCLNTIAEIEYDGWLVLETHGHNPEKHGPLDDVLKYNMAYLKTSVLWR